jgi:hypothetical protein
MYIFEVLIIDLVDLPDPGDPSGVIFNSFQKSLTSKIVSGTFTNPIPPPPKRASY